MDIDLLSLSTSPSDHECKDGDLSGMCNVVREDGALHIIPQPVTVAEIADFGYELTDTKFYIHKVDNDDVALDDHTNWFAIVSNDAGNHVLWCNDINDQKWITVLDGFKVNAISFTGRIVSLVGDTETRWLQWDGTTYNAYCLDDFEYGVQIFSESAGTDTFENEFSETPEEYFIDADGIPITDHTKETKAYGLSKIGMAALLEIADAEVNSTIEAGDNLHKYKSFGFCALRMYDGNYIRISDIFYLGGKFNTISLNYYKSSSTQYASITTDLHSHTIAIGMSNIETVKNLILGVDVFLCAPSFYRKTNEAHKFTGGYCCPWDDSTTRSGTVTMHSLDDRELINEIDNLSFHRVLRIETKDISAVRASAPQIDIPAYDETGSVLTLEDFYESHYGAKVAHNYNGRLNIGDVTNTITFKPLNKIEYTWDSSYIRDMNNQDAITWGSVNYPVYLAGQTPKRFTHVDVYFVIRYTDDSQRKTVYAHSNNVPLPMPPIFMLPYTNIESVDMYVGKAEDTSDWPDTYRNKYWSKTNMEFHTSATGNWSYLMAPGMNLLSPIIGVWNTTRTELVWSLTGNFTEITATEYATAGNAYNDGAHELSVRYRNRIFSSESNNPFLFKATNQVVVGNGTVLALNAPTQPISEGQAGSTPLVAFTTEGIYPLYVDSSTGLFSATQPGPRDVIIKGDDGYNTEAVTAIDNAILFPTDRGLMMYSGSQTTCLTDTLAGTVNDVDLPHLYYIMAEEGFENTGDNISYYGLGEKLHTFLQTCRIAFDYTSQRIMVYTPQTDGVINNNLVYSLKSGAWGMAESNLRQALNAYPQALCISASSSNKGSVVDLYNPSPDATDFYAITRPIGFGAPHTLKRVSQSIIRGLFTQGSVKCAVYGSRDLKNWYLLNSSTNHYLRGRFGAPYKYYRYVIIGTLNDGETVECISADVTESLTNKLR
jgi:hypothetical protein